MQNDYSTMQLTSPISFENLKQSRLGELSLSSIDVDGAGDCFDQRLSQVAERLPVFLRLPSWQFCSLCLKVR